MKATITQISRAIYDIRQESHMFPEKKAFDELPFHRLLHYRTEAIKFIKVYKKLVGNVEVVNGKNDRG